MNPFQDQRIRGHGGFRIVAKNPKMFLRPVDQPRGNMPTPTTDMAYPLSLGQETLTASQGFFGAPPLTDLGLQLFICVRYFSIQPSHPPLLDRDGSLIRADTD